MSLVFAGLVPHSPILLGSIAKGEEQKAQKTLDAISLMEQNLYISKPEILCIITPHGSLYEESFSINSNTNFISDFSEFGDLKTQKNWAGAPEIAAKISHACAVSNISVQQYSEEKLDHGSSVPLILLTNYFKNIKILPIGHSHLSPKIHLDFGKLLKDIFMESNKRIAMIASSELSKRLSPESPEGHHVDGEKFDNQLVSLLETRNTAGISQMDPELIKNAKECGYFSILILLGALQNMNYDFKNLCYEAPFGAGYLTAEFNF
jgi:AmmeMemoRadiSam system protein B